MTDKQTIIKAIKLHIETTMRMHEQNLADIRSSIANEGKRTAGDKHETALASLQLEQERIGKHLLQINEQLQTINTLEKLPTVTGIEKECLITTDKGLFFLGVPAGKVSFDGSTVFAVSMLAPIAEKLINTPIGAAFTLNSQTYKVLSKK